MFLAVNVLQCSPILILPLDLYPLILLSFQLSLPFHVENDGVKIPRDEDRRTTGTVTRIHHISFEAHDTHRVVRDTCA